MNREFGTQVAEATPIWLCWETTWSLAEATVFFFLNLHACFSKEGRPADL
jgi:hypothetical protein